MAVTTRKAPEPPEAPEGTAPETTDDGLVEKVETAVRDVLGKLLDSGEITVVEGETGTPKKDERPASPRQEEVRMEDLVAKAVKELKKTEATAPAEPERKEPETVPGPRGWRNKLWGD